jgi:hypothetical protein
MCDDDLTDLRCLWRGGRRRPVSSYRYKILYVSPTHTPLSALRAELTEIDCYLDYCPAGWLARSLLQSAEVSLALLLLADVSDASAAELAAYARTLKHRAQTPSLIFNPADDVRALAEMIRSLLAKIPDPPRQW